MRRAALFFDFLGAMLVALIALYAAGVQPDWLPARAPAPADTVITQVFTGSPIRARPPGEVTETGQIIGLVSVPGGPVIPVFGLTPDELHDSFGAPRSAERTHTGIDILAPKGTPIGAAVDGWIVSLSFSEAGGTGLAQLDRTGRLLLYYGHLDSYAEPMYRGRAVRRGELLGYVGDTGNARGTPHLHFEVGRVAGRDTLNHIRAAPLNPYEFLTGRVRG